MFRVPPLVTFVNRSDPLLEAIVTEGRVVTFANWAPVAALVAKVPAPLR